MPISTWIRDLFGIRKDAVDTKKAKLEITKLEAEERQRELITPASLNDVKKYDPKYEELIRRMLDETSNKMLSLRMLTLVELSELRERTRQLRRKRRLLRIGIIVVVLALTTAGLILTYRYLC
jgi:hypothetical protein